jgi:hypothetical protein
VGKVTFDDLDATRLFDGSRFESSGRVNGATYQARVLIADYDRRIESHYGDITAPGLGAVCATASIPFGFRHFGVLFAFDRLTEIDIHDADMVLRDGLRDAIARFGAVVFRNAFLSVDLRRRAHRNIFPHLRFHYDRGPRHENRYSLFTRDPFDPVQAEPRLSSTLIAANIVAYLQLREESPCDVAKERGMRASYDLFGGQDMDGVLGNIVLEQAWDAPRGTGEIVVIDNRTVQHAAYYRTPAGPGYPIGARYLY